VSNLQRIETTGTLQNLAAEINHYHAKCEEAVGQAVAYAIEAGRMLEEAKAGLKHGEWLGWLEANFEGWVRTAQVYMRLASRRALVEAVKAQGRTVYYVLNIVKEER